MKRLVIPKSSESHSCLAKGLFCIPGPLIFSSDCTLSLLQIGVWVRHGVFQVRSTRKKYFTSTAACVQASPSTRPLFVPSRPGPDQKQMAILKRPRHNQPSRPETDHAFEALSSQTTITVDPRDPSGLLGTYKIRVSGLSAGVGWQDAQYVHIPHSD